MSWLESAIRIGSALLPEVVDVVKSGLAAGQTPAQIRRAVRRDLKSRQGAYIAMKREKRAALRRKHA